MNKIYKSLLAIIILGVSIFCISGCDKTVYIDRIEFEQPEINVVHGETFTVKANVFPQDASIEEIENIAWTVSSNSVVQEKKDNNLSRTYIAAEVGSGVIKLSINDGVYAECNITIEENEDDIAIRKAKEEEERIAAEKRAEEERIAAEKRAEEERKAKEEAEKAEKKKKADNLAIPCAKQILEETLKDPYPIYQNAEIIKSDDYMRYIVSITFNARNSFGGYVGNQTYLIGLRITDVNKKLFTYNYKSVMEEATLDLYSLYGETDYENFFFENEWNKEPQ